MQDSINSTRHIHFIGFCSGCGARDTRCALGPDAMYKTDIQNHLQTAGYLTDWKMVEQQDALSRNTTETISEICHTLSEKVSSAVSKKQPFVVIGGDHSCAIGTWSGVAVNQSPFGLIWIDAHLDSHTPTTSHTHTIHGMPLASLLGFGDHSLTHLPGPVPKLQARDVYLIGARSFEAEELQLLKKHKVHIHFMSDIKASSLKKIINDAIKKLSDNTINFGISIDLDAIDPEDAPGVGSPEPDGLSGNELVAALSGLAQHPGFLGIEIAELNPALDKNNKTAQLSCALIESVFKGALS